MDDLNIIQTCSNRKKIISILIDNLSYSSFVERVLQLAKSRTSSYVCLANVHMLVEAFFNKSFACQVNSADLISPDGMPLITSFRLLYSKHQDRIAGIDLVPDLYKVLENNKLTPFFYGSTNDILALTDKYLSENHPNILNKHFYSPPFRDLTDNEYESIVKMINDTNPNIVFVVLGCPKQEKWMAKMKGHVNACMIGIGGALPVSIGLNKKAPEWMRRNHLEWSYRLFQEPRRLINRYVVTNSIFIFLLLVEILKINLKKLFSFLH